MYTDIERVGEFYGVADENIPDFIRVIERLFISWTIRFAEHLLRDSDSLCGNTPGPEIVA